MRNSDCQEDAKSKEQWPSENQPKPMETRLFGQMRKVREHFVVPGLQHDEHDKRKGKDNIGNDKGVGENVEDRTGFDVDGYGLVKLLSISKHTHEAQNKFCNC